MLLVVLGAILLSAAPRLPAQEWSAAQKEVWSNVEAYWKLEAAGDLAGFMACFDEDYLGWEINDALPSTKAEVKRWVEHDLKTTKILVQQVNPIGIKLHGEVAFVHYYYSRLVKDSEGKEKQVKGRWTDILKKKGDKWLLIGDSGGRSSKKDE